MTIGIEATKAHEREKTGVGWYCYYIVKEIGKIIDSRTKLWLYVNPQARITNYQLLITNTPRCQNVAVKQLAWLPRKFWTQVRLSYEMLAKPPDVLFIPAHLPPLIHPKKLVVTVHDLAFKQYPEVYSKRELRLQEWGVQRVLKKAWRIITPSEFTKNEVCKWYPRHKKDTIFVIPHGVIKVQNSKLKTKNYNSKLKTIIYIGRLESKKNIVNLIKTFNISKSCKLQVASYKLILIGSPGYGYEAIKKEIDASPYKNDIIQTGWQDREEVAKHLHNATLFVFPSLYEGFGMPLLEAFATGTPVSCSDIPPLREVGADVPLYFNPRDPVDMAEKIQRLLTNPELQKQKSAEGLARAREFSWKRAAEKTLDILIA